MKHFIKRKPIVVCDIEVSPNAFLIGFKSYEKRKEIQLGLYGEDEKLSDEDKIRLKKILTKYAIVTFNGQKYDMPIILRALQQNVSCKQIFEMSKLMIEKNMVGWITMRQYNIRDLPGLVHIDLMNSSPGVMVSLKMFGARLHSKKLQDLPYEYDKHLTPEEYKLWCEYNINDLDTTIDLYSQMYKAIDLRYDMSDKYQIDLMSKGDAQIAETVILFELKNSGVNVGKVSLGKDYKATYTAPEVIGFVRDDLNELLSKIQEESFELSGNGSVKLPKWLSKPIVIGDTKYKVGIGGLHSQEKKLIVESDDTHIMRNADVASYYPSMIIEFGFYPKHIGEKFLSIYKTLYKTRLKAKAAKDMVLSDSLKLTLNGTFGKFGSKWSKLYSPELMLHVTLTGQLMLLMLIEQLELSGIPVKSSNTDGIEYYCKKSEQAKAEAIIFDWELLTGMIMEHGTYKALYARDVNNYVAVYDQYTKAKGAYSDPNIWKNSEYAIVFKAIKLFLFKGIPLEDTIYESEDIREFVISRNVAGGAVWNDEYLGKVVRWYYATNGTTIHYKKNGNKVAKSDSAKPIMTLPDNNICPEDLDREYYVDLSIKHLEDIGMAYASL